MLTSKKDETEQRIQALLQTLSGITFVPENWKEEVFWQTLSETNISQHDALHKEGPLFFQQLIDLKWPWEHIEKLADILIALDTKRPDSIAKERAKFLYEMIQKESKVFSFDIMKKIANL